MRQVIGLRQYGQKDPLSEFKKEAFLLFEGLLSKIKNDLIKFLMNLNIVISNEETGEKNQESVRQESSKKRSAEMKNVLAALEKNTNIVTEIFKSF